MLFVSTGPAISNSVESPNTTRFFSADATIEIGEGRLTVTVSESLQYDVFGSFTGDDPATVTGTVTGIRILISEDGGEVYTGNGWLYPSGSTTWESIRNMTYSEIFLGDDHLEGGRFGDDLAGYGGHDILWGRQGDDVLLGGAGNDTLVGGNENDFLDGGEGVDTASYNGAEGRVRVDLNITGSQDTLGHGIDTIVNTENLTGSQFNDTLFGNEGANELRGAGGADELRGRGGRDVLNGQAGNDLLLGGQGNDTLTGGAGNDTFNFSNALNATNNVDTITDFVSGVDTIELDNDFFTAIGFLGDPPHGGFFHAGTAAVNPDQRIIYDANTGSLYYDADGSGAGAQVRFAVLGTTTHPALDFSDFSIVD